MASLKNRLKKSLPGVFKVLSNTKQAWRNRKVQEQVKTLPDRIEQDHPNLPGVKDIVSFVRSNGVSMIPYPFVDEYSKVDLQVKSDNATGLDYVVVNGNRIFFPKTMTHKYIIDSVRVGIVEQDERSPHRYLPIEGHNISGDIAVVCGASDCIYTLSIIDKFNKIYLFEANDAWVPAIQATLKGYENKYEIVPFYVSDTDGEGTITLDSFFARKSGEVNYLQADIEGAEASMLNGARSILTKSSKVDISICCYHTDYQEKEVRDILESLGYNVKAANGYVLMWMDYPLKTPYLRKGVLYASK